MATEAAQVDPFDSAFADLIREEGKTAPATQIAKPDMPNMPEATPAAPAAPDPAAPPAAQADPAPPAEDDEPATELEATEGEPPAPPEPEPAPKPPVAQDDALSRLADMLAQRQPQPAPQPAPQPRSPYSQEDTAFLSQYHTDFPDVARAESMIRRAEYSALTTHIFNEVGRYFAPKLALLEQLADTTAYSQLTQRVPNYDAVREPLIEWVKTQPGYLQAAYNHVIQNGTVDEIGDLVDRFGKATGMQPPSAPQGQGGGAAPAKPAAELSPAAKQAVARLAPVNGKRTAPTQGAPQTFDAAFDAFAKEAS